MSPEGCYVQVLTDVALQPSSLRYSLASVNNLYGTYATVVQPFDATENQPRLLQTLDVSGHVLAQYPLMLDLMNVHEDVSVAEPYGEFDILDQGTGSAIIPYDKRIAGLRVVDHGVATDMTLAAGAIRCTRTCKLEHERVSEGERCCDGFALASQHDGTAICVVCGDGTCGSGEDDRNCPADCKPDFVCATGYVKTDYGCEVK